MEKIESKKSSHFLNVPFYKTKGYLKGSFKKSKAKYIKATIIGLLIGFIIGSFFILFSKANPFTYFGWVVKIAFDPLFISSTIILIALYILASISLSIGFKCKVFNIGIAGQMMLSGCLVTIMGIKNPTLSQSEIIIYGLLISIVSGILLSLIAALLKAFFNVHEVVTTIMLNWAIYYFLKWLFIDKGTDLGIWNSSSSSSTPITNPNFNLTLGHNEWILSLLIALTLLFAMGFIFFKTRFGFQTVMLGENNNTAKYTGVKSKFVLINIMMMQGAVAGILGMIYYMEINKGVVNFTTDTYPLFGFNAFAVSLISFNNPYGILIISFIWGILDSGGLPASQLPEFHISKEISSLLFGIIIYCAAIYTLFINFQPIYLFKQFFYNRKQCKNDYLDYKKEYKILHKEYSMMRKEIKTNFKKEKNKLFLEYKQLLEKKAITNLQYKEELWIKISLLKKLLKNNLNIELQKIKYLKTQYKDKYKNNYQEYLNSGNLKIKKDYINNDKNLLFKLLNDIVALQYEYKINILHLKDRNKKKDFKKKLNLNIGINIDNYKQEKLKLKNDYQQIIKMKGESK